MIQGRKLVAWSFAITLLLLLIAVVGSSFYMLDFALRPLHRTEREALERLSRHVPDEVSQWVDSVRVGGMLLDTAITINGDTAHAYYLRAAHPDAATAVVVHGYKDTGLSMLHIAFMYNRDLGMNVVLPELPAHGHTAGNHIHMGWGDDVAHVVRWIAVADSMFSADSIRTRMVLHGISMGAATVMNVGGRDNLPECVRCIVEDCGYTSAWDEFSHELRSMFGLPDFPLMYTTSALCRLRYGWSFGQANCLEQVSRCRLPMLLIHGDADDFVPTDMVWRLYAAKPQPKRIWLASGSAHARAYSDHPDEYTRVVGDFVQENGL